MTYHHFYLRLIWLFDVVKIFEKYRENHYKIIEKITSKIQNEKCNICKLTLKEFEVIVQCPEGKSYFHKAHLDEWLLDKEKCPICGIKLRGIEN